MRSDRDSTLPWAALVGAGAWFASLPEALQAWLLGHAQVRPLAAGQRLFARGDPPDGIYCVVRGAIRVTGISASGQEAILAVLEAPQWFGEIALFDGQPRTHDAWVDAGATVLRVPQDALARMLAEAPAHWRHFGRLLTQKLRMVFVALEEEVFLPPTSRLARRLAGMAEGHGAWSGRSRRAVSVSQAQLGLMLALSRQTVNQSLRQLELAGAILRGRGVVEILDLKLLNAHAIAGARFEGQSAKGKGRITGTS